MMGVFSTLKLIMFLSLISMTLSFGVLIGSYTKSPLNSRDRRFNKALTMVNKRDVENNGGYGKVKVYPIAAYRQIVNGVNYKIINIIKDETNLKVDLVASDVHTEFSGNDPDGEVYFFDEGYYPITFFEQPGNKLAGIADFLQEYLSNQNFYIQKIHSAVNILKINNNESFYLVNTLVESEGKSFTKYLVLSKEEGKGYSVLENIDFIN